MGVGDLAVPKRMQAFAEAFYGRQAAYLAALDAADQRVFEKALARNIFPAGDEAGAAQLARYARAAVTRLDAQDDGALIRGEVVFPSPEAFARMIANLNMSERKADKQAPAPWQVPVAVEDVAETGRHFDLVADNDVRAAVARMVGLRDLPRLEANFDVTRHGADGLHVCGRVSATVGQNCVVTLEPLANEVEEDIDLLFAPPPPPSSARPARTRPPKRIPNGRNGAGMGRNRSSAVSSISARWRPNSSSSGSIPIRASRERYSSRHKTLSLIRGRSPRWPD